MIEEPEIAINEFIENPPINVAICRDGRPTVDRFGESYEALCIDMSSSSGYADEKLLAEQKLQHATGKAQAEGTFDVIYKWNVKYVVTTSGFDNAASNSGWKGVAAKLLENTNW